VVRHADALVNKTGSLTLLLLLFLIQDKFEEAKEMKLEYTTLFEEYTRTVERMIESALAEKVPVRIILFSFQTKNMTLWFH
jgi:hypothetical protein